MVESSVARLQALVRAGDLSYELTLVYLSRIREIEVTLEISECRDQSEPCVRRRRGHSILQGVLLLMSNGILFMACRFC